MITRLFNKKSRAVIPKCTDNWVQLSGQRLRLANSAQQLWNGTEAETTHFEITIAEGAWNAWLESQGLYDTLQEYQAEVKAWTQRSICCVIPDRLTVSEVLNLPVASRSEREQMIREELSENSRLRNDTFTFDYHLMNSVEVTDEEQTIQVTAINQQLIESLVRQFYQAGICCRRIITHSQFLAELAGRQAADMTGMLDWGHDSIQYVLAEQNRPLYERQLRGLTLSHLVHQLAADWKLSVSSVTALLRQIEQQPGTSSRIGLISTHSVQNLKAEYRTACEQLAEEMAMELKRTVEFSRQKYYAPNWNGVVVGGGVSTHPTLLACLQEKITFPLVGWKHFSSREQVDRSLQSGGLT